MIQYLRTSGDTVLAALQQHVLLALLPVVFGLLIALPIGYLRTATAGCTRRCSG
jgi:osmoprotectant transport system permease protein